MYSKSYKHTGNNTRTLFIASLMLLFAILTSACSFDYGPSETDIENALVPNAVSRFYDADGNVIYTTASAEHRIPVPFNKIPENVKMAFISIEDNRFYEHSGIDYIGTTRAAFSTLLGHEVQGGSTITQQLAKNAFLTQERTIKRKIKEAFLAKKLENSYTKDEILRMYLNRIYFGEGAYGVESASLFYFGKHVWETDLAEAATLAAIPKSPNYYNPITNLKASTERRAIVLDQMVKYGHITQAQAEAAKKEKLQPSAHKIGQAGSSALNYFYSYISQEIISKYGANALYKGGLKVYTTIDSKMQNDAVAALRYLPNIYTKDPDHLTQPQVALIAIDPKTGYIRAMIGGRGQDKFNRAVQAIRQPGSAFKPFVYLTAMDKGMTAADIVDDSEITIGDWTPHNYGHNFKGKMSLRTALIRSVNIPAIKVAQIVGINDVIKNAQALGLSTLVTSGRKNDCNLATALGGLTKGVTPLDMAAAYGTIGNNGVYNKPVAITKILDRNGRIIYQYSPNSKRVISAKAAYQTTDMLEDVFVRGTAGGAGIGRPAAGKTGTTDNYKDAWFVGYTPNLSCAVWIGDDRSRSMGIMTGSMAPLSIWHAFMTKAVQGIPNVDFVRPEGAVTPPEPEIIQDDEKEKLMDEKGNLDPEGSPDQLIKKKKAKKAKLDKKIRDAAEELSQKLIPDKHKVSQKAPVISNKPVRN